MERAKAGQTAAARITVKVAPYLALAAGAGMLLFALAFHRLPVIVPAQEAPSEPGFGPPIEAPPGIILPDGPPGGFALAPPPEEDLDEIEVRRPTVVISTENEIIRETTRGGVTLNESGEVQRTYADQPPQVCPT